METRGFGSLILEGAGMAARAGRKLVQEGPVAALRAVNEHGVITKRVRRQVRTALVGLAHTLQETCQEMGTPSIFIDGAQNGFADIRHSAARRQGPPPERGAKDF